MAQQIRYVLLNGTDAAGGMQDDDLARMNSNLAQHFFDVVNDVQIIFERADNYLERISFRQVSPESLAAALKPYVDVDNISFDQVIDNTKYIKAAYLLGVRKYQPRFKGDNLGLAIYENDYMTSVEKQELFEWLLEQNYFSTNPLSLQTMLNGLISGKDLSFGCLLKKFPIDEAQIERYYPLDIDPANQHKRNNILHASVYEGNILKMWNSFLNIYSTEEMVQLLLETNKLNRSALFLIVSNYLNDANRLPKEILLGFMAIAKSGDLNQLKDFNTIMQFEGSSVYLLMYKYGITPDKIQQGQLYYQQANNPFEIAHNKSYQFNEQTNNASNSCWSLTDTFPIETMLPELIWTISEYLDITGLVGLFTASKTMTRFIKKKDDRFWRQVYERNIYVNNKIHSYKKMVLECARSAPNWLKRNFNKITLDGIQASSLMDENWLVLFDSLCIYLWDCHTQQTHLICETDGQMWRYEPIRILGGVYDGTCPPVLLREKGNDGITVIYRLAVNGEFILLDELQHQGVADFTENSKMISIHQIDENLLLLPNNKIFDIQSRTFIDSTTSNHIGLIYNPFNHTYITLNGKRLFEIRDMNHQPLRQFEAKPECNNSLIRLLNESTLIIYSGYGSIWLIDFKGTDVVQKVISPDHSRFSSFKLPYSLDRAILADNRTGLVTICHLPSMQWQAVYHLQATVTAANSRYLVGNENGNAVIYDFYK